VLLELYSLSSILILYHFERILRIGQLFCGAREQVFDQFRPELASVFTINLAIESENNIHLLYGFNGDSLINVKRKMEYHYLCDDKNVVFYLDNGLVAVVLVFRYSNFRYYFLSNSTFHH
jgi:hypothetical protein